MFYHDPARKHVELISWPRTDCRRWPDQLADKSQLSEHRYPAIPRPSWESLRILQWHQKSPAIFARRRKSIPASSSTSTFYVPSYTKKFDRFWLNNLDHKPQAKQAPRDPSPWYCIHIMLTVTARYMIRSLQRHSGLFTTTRIRNRMLGYC